MITPRASEFCADFMSVVLSVIEPEMTPLVLVGVGLAGFLVFRWRKWIRLCL